MFDTPELHCSNFNSFWRVYCRLSRDRAFMHVALTTRVCTDSEHSTFSRWMLSVFFSALLTGPPTHSRMHSWSHMYPWVLGCARTHTHPHASARVQTWLLEVLTWAMPLCQLFPVERLSTCCFSIGSECELVSNWRLHFFHFFFFLEASTSSWPLTSHSILHAFPPRIITNSTQQSWLGLTHMSTGLINARSFSSFAAAAATGERSPYPNSTLLRLPSPLAVTVLWCFVSIVSCFFFFPRRAHRGCLQTLSLFPCWFSHSHRKRFRWTAFFWVFLFAQVSTVLLLEININTSFSAMYQTRTASFVKDST